VEGNIDIMKKNTEAVLNFSKTFRVGKNIEKNMYIVTSRFQNAGQKHRTDTANMFFEDVQSSISEKSANRKSYLHEEIKRGLNSGNVCYHSVQGLLSSYSV
jgi:hypothetical protein